MILSFEISKTQWWIFVQISLKASGHVHSQLTDVGATLSSGS